MPNIRNRHRNVVIIPAPYGGESVISLSPRGDMSGGDIVVLDDETMQKVPVRTAISRGYIEEISDEAVDSLREDVDSRIEDEAQDRERAAAEVIDARPDNSMVGLSCIGPGVRPSLPCDNMILRPTKDVRSGDTPPLCKAHANLAHEYTYTEGRETDPSTGESRPVSKWTRMAMGAPVKAESV